MAENQTESGKVLKYEVIQGSFTNRYPPTDERCAFFKEFLPDGDISDLVTKANVIKTLQNEKCASNDIDSLGTLRGDISVELNVGSVKRADFDKYQWSFLAPKFDIDTFQSAEYQYAQIFPYIDPQGLMTPFRGGFSIVRKVVLHKDHRNGQSPYCNDPENDFIVAVKTLHANANLFTNVDKFYDKERTTLQKMAELKHDHLIKAISAYKKGPDKYFLFPWARGGNLRQIWAQESNSTEGNVVSWALEQMVGLTEGISALHKEKVRHGDLKPENILFFPEDIEGHRFSGPLVIADVGLAKFHEDYTVNRQERTTTNSRTICYEPPELTIDKEKPVSRKYDLWSLGCIFLEFLIWIRFGNSHVQKFSTAISSAGGEGRFWKQSRGWKFWQETTNSAKLHPTVARWITKDLKEAGPHDQLVSELADLIASHLLVIDKEKRDSDGFLQGLKDIQNRAEDVSKQTCNDATSSPAEAEPLFNTPANRSNQVG
ncbi:unnamed protein product [Clonostachys byssicola]|uniref:Protein kinase domain-containing protein n=1 Tax=Clonostachys byssicola TaxID=160290 RepID=A0A9N9YCT1_9HYPO|nr:unnamed protein product [Clonostachys byssicola]